MAKKIEKDENALWKELEDKFDAFFEPEKIKTGIIPLDLALNGYLETGSLIELSGESQTGKSTLLLELSRIMCEKGYKVAYIDSEGSVKDDQLSGIGLLKYKATKTDRSKPFLLVRESRYKQLEDLIDSLVTYGDYKLIIIDSLTAVAPDEFIDLDSDHRATDARVAYEAQLNSRLLQKLNVLKSVHNCIFAFINQTRIDMSGWMATYKSTGGQAVKFYPDVRLFMKLKNKIKDKQQLAIGEMEIPIGADTTIEAHKSRLGLGFIPYPMTIYFGKGISHLKAVEDLLPNIMVDTADGQAPILEQASKVTYVLHLPSGDVKTTKGANGITELVKDNFEELYTLVNDYLDKFFEDIRKDREINTDNLIIEEAASEDIEVNEEVDNEGE